MIGRHWAILAVSAVLALAAAPTEACAIKQRSKHCKHPKSTLAHESAMPHLSHGVTGKCE